MTMARRRPPAAGACTMMGPRKIKKALEEKLRGLGELMISITSPLWVRVFRFIARTGAGTDICLRHGFLPLPVHFHSPVPDLDDLERRQVWDKKSNLAGIDFQPDKQVRLLRELGEKFGGECDWPAAPTGTPLAFYTENNSFSFGCAASLHSMIRRFKPARIVEIGSGNSSLIISSALTRNQAEDGPPRGRPGPADGSPGEYVIIDPIPHPVTGRGLPGLTAVRKERVELTDPGYFRQLRENDILFIDSGHTVRTGGDVNFLFLDVLPRLAPGVIVHVHDIGLPYEYQKIYFTNPGFRMFWTEAYLLQAFLCCNSQFEILLAMTYLMTEKKDEFARAFQRYDPMRHKSVSGSFWLRRTTKPAP